MPVTDTHEVQHLIDGRRVGSPVSRRYNPADANDLVAIAPSGTANDVENAVVAAQRAQSDWAGTPGPARGAILSAAAQILEERIEAVAVDLTREEGKTLAEAKAEVIRASEILRFQGGQGWRLTGEVIPTGATGQLVYTLKEPVGVVAVITPWNFPIAIPAWKIAPALVAGNTVIFKPASFTVVTAHHLVDALQTAGLPDGVINLVYGSGADVGTVLVSDPRVDAVTFTGSTEVGNAIHDHVSARGGRIQLEMGGKNALVVLDDADPAASARVAAAGAFGLTGQACTSTSRIVATPGIITSLTEAIEAQMGDYQPGNGLEEGIRMGPVVSQAQLATDLDYVRLARDEGAQVVSGGAAPAGLLLPPTLLSDVEPSHRVAQEEVFGPVLAVLAAHDFEQAVAITNDTKYGLTAGICTQDLELAHRFAVEAKVGVVKVNRPTTGLDLNVPFGGVKQSSTATYREQGMSATDFFMVSKSVYLGYA